MNLNYNNKIAHKLLQEINKVKKINNWSNYTFSQEFPELRELRTALRTQLAGLIDVNDEWIEYTNIDSVKQELYETEERMKHFDPNNPFQSSLPYKEGNLWQLFQSMCPHKNTSYQSLRGSIYRNLVCDDCKSECGPMEFKPKVIEMMKEQAEEMRNNDNDNNNNNSNNDDEDGRSKTS